MKKSKAWRVLFAIMVCCMIFTSCQSKESSEEFRDLRPMIRVLDELYLDTGKEVPVEIDDSAIIGEILSSVDSSKRPTKNGQTNFGFIGARYAYYEEEIVILINNEWILFEKEE